jgi:hypothetical protein
MGTFFYIAKSLENGQLTLEIFYLKYRKNEEYEFFLSFLIFEKL